MLVGRSGGFWVWDGAADIAPLPTQAHHPLPAIGWSAQTLHKPLNPSLPESKAMRHQAGRSTWAARSLESAAGATAAHVSCK